MEWGVWSLEFGVWSLEDVSGWRRFRVGGGLMVSRGSGFQGFRVSEFLLKMEGVGIGMNCRDAIYCVS